MQPTQDDLIYGIAVPAIVAFVVCLVRKFWKADVFDRYAAVLAIVPGFAYGYFRLKLGPVVPDADWEFLPYALIGACVAGPVAAASGTTWLDRGLLYALAGAVLGWLIVPTWEELDPSRLVHFLVLGGYIVVVASCLEPAGEKLAGPIAPAVIALACAGAAVVAVLSGSARFGQTPGLAAGAFAGVTLAACLDRSQNSLRGAAPAIAGLLGGMMLLARASSYDPLPLACYLLIPAVPLLLSLAAAGPLSKATGFKRVLAQLLPALIAVGTAVGLAIAEEYESLTSGY
jgi:hypothetical protein